MVASPKRVAAAFCAPIAKASSSAPQRTVTNAQIAKAAADSESGTAGAQPRRTRPPEITTPIRNAPITAT